jgi:hypothetical protein
MVAMRSVGIASISTVRISFVGALSPSSVSVAAIRPLRQRRGTLPTKLVQDLPSHGNRCVRGTWRRRS